MSTLVDGSYYCVRCDEVTNHEPATHKRVMCLRCGQLRHRPAVSASACECVTDDAGCAAGAPCDCRDESIPDQADCPCIAGGLPCSHATEVAS